jgi:hypothetical protein
VPRVTSWYCSDCGKRRFEGSSDLPEFGEPCACGGVAVQNFPPVHSGMSRLDGERPEGSANMPPIIHGNF